MPTNPRNKPPEQQHTTNMTTHPEYTIPTDNVIRFEDGTELVIHELLENVQQEEDPQPNEGFIPYKSLTAPNRAAGW
jgi:hypothetical protein